MNFIFVLEEIKPYFKLENVREGAFAVANKLYGITLTKLEGIQIGRASCRERV